jgi:hypothetical protein
MGLTHTEAARNAVTNALVDLFDVGAGANGTIELLDAAVSVVECDLDEPAFGGAAAGVATAATISEGTAVANGTVDNFKLKDEDGTEVVAGTVGISHAITGVTIATHTFEIAADLSAIMTAGTRFRITGSTGNDGWYTVVSATFGATLAIVVVETIADATVDGLIHPYDLTIDNPAIVIGQTVRVNSLTYQGEVT